MASPRLHVGAYGLVLDADLFGARNLVDAERGWTPWTVLSEVVSADEIEEQQARAGVSVHMADGSLAVMTEQPPTTRLLCRQAVTQEWLLHPGLAGTAVVAAEWRGDVCFHGGVASRDGRTFAVLGGKGDGKSTTLAALHQSGWNVLTDDLVVVQNGNVLAGPRCLDLRAESAESMGLGHPLGVVGMRERWRVLLPQVSATARLDGFVVLHWADAAAVTLMRPVDRLRQLLVEKTPAGGEGWPARALQLSRLPMYAFGRPRDVAAAGRHLELLASALLGQPGDL